MICVENVKHVAVPPPVVTAPCVEHGVVAKHDSCSNDCEEREASPEHVACLESEVALHDLEFEPAGLGVVEPPPVAEPWVVVDESRGVDEVPSQTTPRADDDGRCGSELPHISDRSDAQGGSSTAAHGANAPVISPVSEERVLLEPPGLERMKDVTNRRTIQGRAGRP